MSATGWVGRWRQFRRDQRAQLEELRHERSAHLREADAPVEPDPQLEHDLMASIVQPGDQPGGQPGDAPHQPQTHPAPAATGERPSGTAASSSFGQLGNPINRQSPFYIGFVGAIGVLVAYALMRAIAQLDTTITLIVVAFVLALALNPIVELLTRRRLRRGVAVSLVFLAVLAVFAIIGRLVIPPVVDEGTQLANNAPQMLDQVMANPWVRDLDARFGLINKIQHELELRIADGNLWATAFGGVLGAGRVLVSSVFSTFTVLVLSLYFLASLPALKQAAYALVPATRRPRIVSLSEEIMRRVGGYAIGQVSVATINACCAWVMMTLLGLPYAAVLAVVVGFLGLIPLVGATIGAAVVAIAAALDEPKKAIVVLAYFLVYQQIENYAVMPRIMRRTVAVPGAVTVVAALAGGTMLGILGALIAIPVAAGLLLIYDEVLVPRQRRH